MKVPFAKPDLTGNELRYLTECISTGYVTHAGRFERDFEKAFSDKFGMPCIATSSGTGALHLALLSMGIGAGDEVIVRSKAGDVSRNVSRDTKLRDGDTIFLALGKLLDRYTFEKAATATQNAITAMRTLRDHLEMSGFDWLDSKEQELKQVTNEAA